MYVSEGQHYTNPSLTERQTAEEEIKAKLKMADALMEEAADIADKYGLHYSMDVASASIYYEGKGTAEGGNRYSYEPDWDSSGYGWYSS